MNGSFCLRVNHVSLISLKNKERCILLQGYEISFRFKSFKSRHFELEVAKDPRIVNIEKAGFSQISSVYVLEGLFMSFICACSIVWVNSFVFQSLLCKDSTAQPPDCVRSQSLSILQNYAPNPRIKDLKRDFRKKWS